MTEPSTEITFRPDPEIFDSACFSVARITDRLHQLAFLYSGLRLSLTVEASGARKEFFAPNGLADCISDLNRDTIPLGPVVSLHREFGEIVIGLALQWVESDKPGMRLCFLNDEPSPLGGTPIGGLHTGIKKALMRFQYHREPAMKALAKFDIGDFADGLSAVVSIRHPDPQWEGATKSRVNNLELEKLVAGVVAGELASRFVADLGFGQRIWDRCSAREQASRSARRKRARKVAA